MTKQMKSTIDVGKMVPTDTFLDGTQIEEVPIESTTMAVMRDKIQTALQA
jgi:hypothetical protein